jgi:hypothetical protein
VHVWNVYDPSTYRDGVIEHIISIFNSQYPMPEQLAVSSVWLCRTTLGHIANRRSGYRRAARVALDRDAAGFPQRLDGGRLWSIHNAEWRAGALARGASERSARHVTPRATQMWSSSAVTWGSGGAAAFRAEFVSILENYKCLFN